MKKKTMINKQRVKANKPPVYKTALNILIVYYYINFPSTDATQSQHAHKFIKIYKK